MVEDFLINCSAYYIDAGIDIYYYDSSVSSETEELIYGWPDREHLYYVKMPSELSANAKAYKIFQGYGLKKKYDFIWLSNDGLQCSKLVIQKLMSALSLEYDIVEISHTDRENVGTRIFTDPNKYMLLCAWHLGLFGAAVLNSHTMLEAVDWKYYEDKFLVPALDPFSHVSFYFHRILELKRFCAFFLSVPQSHIKESKLKKDIGWRKNFFSVLCESWVQTIEGLPQFYTNKKSACVKLGDLSLLKEIEAFYRLRLSRDGQYSLRVYWKYRNAWEKVVSLPKIQLFFAALMPKPFIRLCQKRARRIGLNKLKKFCNAHPRILIYGTGGTGDIYDCYFKKYGLSYEAFCVSHRKPHKNEHLHHPIYEFEEIKRDLSGVGIVVALIGANAEDVLPALRDAVDDSCIFYDPEFVNHIRHEFGYA